MEDMKISQLPDTEEIKGNDTIPIVQEGTTKKITKLNLLKKKTTNIITESEIEANTDYIVPEYVVGGNSLLVYFEGCLLIKDVNYIEVDSTHIKFNGWNVPAGSNLTFRII